MKKLFAVATVAAAALAGSAMAEWVPGQLVDVNGSSGPQFGGTFWGTSANQGQHALGTTSTYWDAVFGSPTSLTVGVSSIVIDPFHLSITIDFASYFPGDFTLNAVDIPNLKVLGSINFVGASVGSSSITNGGQGIHWEASGADLDANGDVVKITISNVPAPGALALLGLAGVAGRRRRA